jgi:electron transfer flavoprotein alpha subunit
MLSAGRRAFSAVTRPRLHEAVVPSFARSPAALRRLLSALAILEQRDGKLNTGSLSAVTAAQKLGGSIHAFVAGSSIKGVAEEAAKVEGIEKVIAVDNGAYDKVRLLSLVSYSPTYSPPYLGPPRKLRAPPRR